MRHYAASSFPSSVGRAPPRISSAAEGLGGAGGHHLLLLREGLLLGLARRHVLELLERDGLQRQQLGLAQHLAVDWGDGGDASGRSRSVEAEVQGVKRAIPGPNPVGRPPASAPRGRASPQVALLAVHQPGPRQHLARRPRLLCARARMRQAVSLPLHRVGGGTGVAPPGQLRRSERVRRAGGPPPSLPPPPGPRSSGPSLGGRAGRGGGGAPRRGPGAPGPPWPPLPASLEPPSPGRPRTGWGR